MVRKFILPSIILLGFLVRILATFIIGDIKLENEYEPIVLNMLSGRGFAYYSVDKNNELSTEYLESPKFVIPSAFKSPVYPYFLIPFVKAFGSGPTGMRVIEITQAFMASLMCWFIYEISKIKFGRPQALLSAAGMALYPLLIYSSTQISDTSVFLFLEIIVVLLLVKLEKNSSLLLIIAFSFSVGLFMLARPEGILYFPFCLLWLIIHFSERRSYVAVLFTIICVAILLPWGVRNYHQLGKFTLNTASGLNLWEGQNKDSVGVPSWYVTDPIIEISEEMEMEIRGTGVDRRYEIQQDQVYMRHAIQDIKKDPIHVITLSLKKALFFWTAIYFGINFSYPGAESALYWLPWLSMLPLFFYGMILSLKQYKEYLPFYVIFLFSTFVNMIFFVLPRYTMLIYPWVITFAAHGLWMAYTSFFSRGNA